MSIAVKVGKTSNIKFKGIRPIRAITFDDVDYLIEKDKNVNILIIESITPYEVKEAKATISKAKENGVTIFMFTPKGANTQEEEVSNEKDIDLIQSLDALQHSVSEKIAMNLSTAWGRSTQKRIEYKDQAVKDITKNELFGAIAALGDTRKTKKVNTNISNKSDILRQIMIGDIGSEESLFADESDENNETVAIKESINRNNIELLKLLEEVTREKNENAKALSKAFDQIQTLLDIKDSVEAECNTYKQMWTELKKYTDEGEQVEKAELKKRYDELQRQVEELNNQRLSTEQKIIKYIAEINDLNKGMEKLQGNIERANIERNRAVETINIKEEQIKALLSGKEHTEEELVKLKEEKANADYIVKNLNSKIVKLEEEIDKTIRNHKESDLDRILELKREISKLEEETDKYRNDIYRYESKQKELVTKLELEKKKYEEIDTALINSNSEIAALKVLNDDLNVRMSSLVAEAEEMEKSNVILKIQLEELETRGNKDSFYDTERQAFEEQITRLNNEYMSKVAEVQTIKKELKEVKDKLQDKKTEMIEYSMKVKTELETAESAIEAKEAMEAYSITLTNNVELLKKEVSILTSRTALIEDANTRLEETNKRLRANLAISSIKGEEARRGSINNVFSNLRIDCDYQGEAMIIPVYGSGSYGITTIAMSVAKNLKKANVLFMDMDMVSPKADGWFGKSPIIAELKDISSGNVNMIKTGFGALIEKGTNYVLDNKDTIIQRVAENKYGSTIDYFSGLYTKVDSRKLLGIDFSELLTNLGKIYTHIVVDLGRLGSSEASNEIIRMFNGISYKDLVVTLNNRFDVRAMGVKVRFEQLAMDKMIWILNISDDTSIDTIVKKSTDGASKVIIPKDFNLYGSGRTLDKVMSLKDKLNEIIGYIQNN